MGDSGCALKIDLIEDPDQLHVAYEGKRGVGMTPKCLAEGLRG